LARIDYRRGDELILREVPTGATAVFELLARLPADFMTEGREDAPPEERDGL